LASAFVGFARPTTTPGGVLRARHGPAEARQAQALVRRHAVPAEITATVHGLAAHPEENLAPAAAVSGGADFLATEPRTRRRLAPDEGIAIVTPANAWTSSIACRKTSDPFVAAVSGF
jgi:hypothetical protein